MDILALAPRNHSRARVYVLSIRLLAVSCYSLSFFSACLFLVDASASRFHFGIRYLVVAPFFHGFRPRPTSSFLVSSFPTLFLLFSSLPFPSLLFSSLPLAPILSRYRSFQLNTVNYFFPFFLSLSLSLFLSISRSSFFCFLFLSLQRSRNHRRKRRIELEPKKKKKKEKRKREKKRSQQLVL